MLSVFFSSKCSLFHNYNVFGFCIIHILYTGCAKIKKKIFRHRKVNCSWVESRWQLTVPQTLSRWRIQSALLPCELDSYVRVARRLCCQLCVSHLHSCGVYLFICIFAGGFCERKFESHNSILSPACKMKGDFVGAVLNYLFNCGLNFGVIGWFISSFLSLFLSYFLSLGLPLFFLCLPILYIFFSSFTFIVSSPLFYFSSEIFYNFFLFLNLFLDSVCMSSCPVFFVSLRNPFHPFFPSTYLSVPLYYFCFCVYFFLPFLPFFPNLIPSSFPAFLISCTFLPLYTSCLTFPLFLMYLFNLHYIRKSYFSGV